MGVELSGKLLQLLHELVPGATRFATLRNPTVPGSPSAIAEEQAAALYVKTNQLVQNRHQQIVALAARHRVPTIYANHEAVAAGGLMSYGSPSAENYRLIGSYTGRILKGERPTDLPVQQATTMC